MVAVAMTKGRSARESIGQPTIIQMGVVSIGGYREIVMRVVGGVDGSVVGI